MQQSHQLRSKEVGKSNDLVTGASDSEHRVESDMIPATGTCSDQKDHNDKVIGDHNQYQRTNQVLSQRSSGQSSTLTISYKNSVSLDEPSSNSVTNSSCKARHSVPNVLDSERNTSTIIPKTENIYIHTNNVSHITTTHYDNITPGSEKSAINENYSVQRNSANPNTRLPLDKDSGAKTNDAIQPQKGNIDKDDLQLKWEETIGSKFQVVVSRLHLFDS